MGPYRPANQPGLRTLAPLVSLKEPQSLASCKLPASLQPCVHHGLSEPLPVQLADPPPQQHRNMLKGLLQQQHGPGLVARPSLPDRARTALLTASRRRHNPRRASHSVLQTGLWVVEECSTWDRPADFVPSPWSQHMVHDLKFRDQARPTHASSARSPQQPPANRLWWQSRSALDDETLARAGPTAVIAVCLGVSIHHET